MGLIILAKKPSSGALLVLLALGFGGCPFDCGGSDALRAFLGCETVVDAIDVREGRLANETLVSRSGFLSVAGLDGPAAEECFELASFGETVSNFAAEAAVGAVSDDGNETGIVVCLGFDIGGDFDRGLADPFVPACCVSGFGWADLSSFLCDWGLGGDFTGESFRLLFGDCVFRRDFDFASLFADFGDDLVLTALVGVNGVLGLLIRGGDSALTFICGFGAGFSSIG